MAYALLAMPIVMIFGALVGVLGYRGERWANEWWARRSDARAVRAFLLRWETQESERRYREILAGRWPAL